MDLVLGLGCAVVGVLFGVTIVGVYRDNDHLVYSGIGGICALLVAVLVAGGFLVAFGPKDPGPQPGYCYEAVSRDRVTILPVGKVLIPTTSKYVVLEEVPCR